MHAFTQPPALAARSTRVARRLPSPSRRRAAPAPQSPRSAPRASSEESPRPAPRASSEEARRAETPSEPRRDAHAPRSYTREYSVDGDESYPLGAKGFGRAETNQGVRSTWGGDDANTERRFSFVDPPYEQTVVTAASTHTRHPHVLSVKLPRPVADHIKFQPRTAPPLSGAVAKLRVRRLFGFSFPETSFFFFFSKKKNPESAMCRARRPRARHTGSAHLPLPRTPSPARAMAFENTPESALNKTNSSCESIDRLKRRTST